MTPAKSDILILDHFARFGCVAVGGMGLLVLAGWILHLPILTNIAPGLASMKANTACGFIVASTALWLLRAAETNPIAWKVSRSLSLILLAFSAITLAQDIYGRDFGIDQFLLQDASSSSPTPGRMSPITSSSFIAVGLSLLGLKSRHARIAAIAHWILFLLLFSSLLAIVGYIYGVRSLYQVKAFNSMALHTAATFLLLTLSIKAADPFHGIANIAVSHTAGGALFRRLIPIIPPLLIALGWLRLKGQEAGLYDTRFGLAMMVSFSMTVCVIAIIWTAYSLRRIDLKRSRAETELVDLNEDLKVLLMERTEQVAELSAANAANGLLEQQSLHDGLTKIPNRRFLDTYLAGQIAIARRYKRRVAFVLCDVDSFKNFNDNYGHPAGDECLKLIAAALQSCCRRPADMTARYGGEEFALVLPDTDLVGAAQIAEACSVAVARMKIPHAHSSAGPYVSISGGIAVLDGHSDMTAEQLIAAADQALYRAKGEGRNRMISERAAAA